MKKIISVIGARPQFIKHSPVQLELQKLFTALTIHTGQHYDPNMSDVFFEELQIPRPEFRLELSGKLHGEQTAQMMTKIERIVIREKPDALLVYGDTNSTLAGALVASKLQIPLIHIEAGLRSYNRAMPEEVNRLLTDHISDYLFTPSENGIQNLAKEGITRNVFKCGDVMRDMLKLAQPFLKNKMGGSQYYFATIHRPYNTDDINRMSEILNVFQQLDKKVVFSIHPRTSKLLIKFGIDLSAYNNIIVLEPLSYFDSLSCQKFSSAVITDSGGMQKEAYWLEKQCVTLRSETEWVETLENGCNTLVFDDISSISSILANKPVRFQENLYGSGSSSKEIVDLLHQVL